jgi:4-amino-4-deoxyprephenate dehydrogenase
MLTQVRRCVVVGHGAVGRLFASLLVAEGARVCAVDLKPADGGERGIRVLACDIAHPTDDVRAEMAAADLVFMAVPEPAALTAIETLATVLRPDCVLAHTLSVQATAATAIRRHRPARPAVGLNPLFAPELGLAGRSVAAVVLCDGPGVRELLTTIETCGGRIAYLEPEEHDQRAAVTQALTHAAVLAFGLAVIDLGASPEASAGDAPPPHEVLLALLARISAGTPEVYFDVQAGNPAAGRARSALATAVRTLEEATRSQEEFAALLHRVRGMFGTAHSVHATRAADVIRALSPLGGEAVGP